MKSNKTTSRRLTAFLLFLIIGMCIAIFIAQYLTIQSQNVVIERQLKLINRINRVDSSYTTKTEKYSNIITRYVNGCEFDIDGKKISTTELVRLFNSKINENESLKDSIQYLNQLRGIERQEAIKYLDSFARARMLLQDIKKHYGIEYATLKNDNHTYESGVNKSDSGLILLKYFRNRITRAVDSNGVLYFEIRTQ